MKIAVLIPCYNEEMTIEKVIKDFQKHLPEAIIYVYDNNSKDETAKIAKQAGAIVKREREQGKGNVVRSMFRDINADIYIMIDGDDTYPVEEIRRLIVPVAEGYADMVIGDRLSNGTYYAENKRGFHEFGNKLVLGLINKIFHSHINDIMTGYRVFSRKFVKNVPVMSNGFQIETEFSIFSLEHRMKIVEIPITYRDRPEGSVSKLNTFSDGFKVLLTLFDLVKDYRPLFFFSIIAGVLTVFGLAVGIPVINEFILTSYISKVPSAILAVGLILIAVLNLILGLILDHQTNIYKQQYEMQINNFIYFDNKDYENSLENK